MAVQFIFGRSGSGKTSFCIEALVEALRAGGSEALILLVPEQASYQAERAILSEKRVAGYSRVHVLSFERLQFLLLGRTVARRGLSRIGQQMIIHQILRQCKDNLNVLGSSVGRPGLSRQMSETVSELIRYAKQPQDVQRLAAELTRDGANKAEALKWTDIGLVLAEYVKFVDGRFADQDMELNSARRAVASADFLRGSRLWVDGFAGFTASEMAILGEMLRAVKETQIALCLDASKINLHKPVLEKLEPTSLFYPTEKTYTELFELVISCKQLIKEPIILDGTGRFNKCTQLGHIERHIFGQHTVKIKAGQNVRITAAANARAEARFAAREITRLVRHKGLRYRDIAVIASDISGYEHYLRAYLQDYGIPFFIDRRKALNQHPVVGLICSAIAAVSGGFTGKDIFSYLKSGLVPLDNEDIDLLDNYCLAFGIRGTDWDGEQQWHYADARTPAFDEEKINRIRRKAIEPLLKLRDELCPKAANKKMTSGEFTRIIFDFLEGLNVRQTIEKWSEAAAKRGDLSQVEEHRQFYEKLVDIFDEMTDVFAAAEMTCGDFAAIIGSAFSQMTMAFIPPTLDQVLVGSIERSRHPDLKAVFLLGTTQKQFPVPVGYGGILNDRTRDAAEAAGFCIGAGTQQKLSERQYLAYIAFTRASQYLYVMYPVADDKGRASVRSQFITELQDLFDGLKEEMVLADAGDIEEVYSESELADLLCSVCGKDFSGTQEKRDKFEQLLDEMTSDEQLAKAAKKAASAIEYENSAQLDDEVIKGLFGQRIKGSATRLGNFAACPYSHFAGYVLLLKERQEFKFEPLDVGNFYHRVLDAVLKQVRAEKKDIAQIVDEELLSILEKQISKIVQDDTFLCNFSKHSRHNAYVIQAACEILEDCVLAIAKMIRAGVFRPEMTEVSFGKAEDSLGEFEIALSKGRRLVLSGKIDRIDISSSADGKKEAIVFDYKLGDVAFDWSKFYNGLGMQLPIYMLAVRNAKKFGDIAGAFYLPVKTAIQQVTLEGLVEASEKFKYKAKGIFGGQFSSRIDSELNSGWSKFYNFSISKDNGPFGNYGHSGALRNEDFEKILKFAERRLKGLGEEIVSGRIEVRPYKLGDANACGYCKFKPLCRFDWQINDYNNLSPADKIQVLEEI